MAEIIPAILTNSPQELEEKIRKVEGLVERVQIDIIDGRFADNKTIEPDLLAEIDTDLRIDFHLMTKEPVDWVERCLRGMAERVIGQIELMSDQLEFVGRVGEAGLKVGLALDLDTKVDKIEKGLISNLDVILLMSVKAGYGGQKFESDTIEKIKALKKIRESESAKFTICVDGGINQQNISKLIEAGADEVVVGSHIFEGNVSLNLENLQNSLKNYEEERKE